MASSEKIHLVTGKAATDHVSSSNAGNLNAGMIGSGSYALKVGDQLKASMATANSITVATGAVLHNGRYVEVEEPTTLTVESGTQGQKRNDLVVVRYTLNSDSTEDASLVVIKGTATTGTAADPSYNKGSILDGASISDMPLYRIPLNGISVGTPVALFETLVPQNDAWDSVYPVGSIYMSTASTSPANLFGGTWVQIKDKFLLAAGSRYSAGATGGEATHTLTTSEIPSHSHGTINIAYGSNSGSYSGHSTYWGNNAHSYVGTNSTGGGAAHNNMPPYLAVYMWYRTA